MESFNYNDDRKVPNCARCKNHGLKLRLKGHKRYCGNRSCVCFKCSLTVDRQKIMALQTASRRAQDQDERRVLEVGEIFPTVNESIVQHQTEAIERNVDYANIEPLIFFEPQERVDVPQNNFQHPSSSMTAPPVSNQSE